MESAILKEWYKRITKKLLRDTPTPTSLIQDFLDVCSYPIVRIQTIGKIKPSRFAELEKELQYNPELADHYVHVAMIMWCEEHAPGAYFIATCDDHSIPFVYEPKPLTIEDEQYEGMWAFLFHDEEVAALFKLTFSDSPAITDFHFYFEKYALNDSSLLSYKRSRKKFLNIRK